MERAAACDDSSGAGTDARITLELDVAENVIVYLDSPQGSSGDFEFTITQG